MSRIVVPSSEALTTALGSTARDALGALARALAQEIEQTDDAKQRRDTIRLFVTVVKQIDGMERAAIRETRVHARAEAAMEWMTRRDHERNQNAAIRAALAAQKMGPAQGPASAVITDLRTARLDRTRAKKKPA